MKLFDEKFRPNIGRYLFQCAIATLTIVGVLFCLDLVDHGAIIASLGASTFISFTMPRSYNSSPRRLLGGYAVGIGVGVLCKLFWKMSILQDSLPSPLIATIAFGGIAVGLAMFIMSITNSEHAPACGMALALVLNTWTGGTILFIIGSVLWLWGVKSLLSRFMLDFRDLPVGPENDRW